MSVPLRDRILAATSAFKPAAVEIPALGGTVYVRPMSLGGLSRVQAVSKTDQMRGSVLMLIDCLCDESGKRLFTLEDADALADLPSEAATKLMEAISQSSTLTTSAVKDAEGNS